jgi:hypothetical protein
MTTSYFKLDSYAFCPSIKFKESLNMNLHILVRIDRRQVTFSTVVFK